MPSTIRARTPKGAATSADNSPATMIEVNSRPQLTVSRSSLGQLLRRSRSSDLKGKTSKKQQAVLKEKELSRLRHEASIPQLPPALPSLYSGVYPTALQPLDGHDRPDSLAIMSGRVGNGHSNHTASQLGRMQSVSNGLFAPNLWKPELVDPYARTESMTHRGRYSYASSAISSAINSPRRVRRRKDPTPFNILIIGAQNSGKTSFLNFLKNSLSLPAKRRVARPSDRPEDISVRKPIISGTFTSDYVEMEIEGERIGLTLWDSEGLEKNIVELQLRDITAFLETKFEQTFDEEMKVVRSPGSQDTHIHCVFLILDPSHLDKNIASAKTKTANGSAKHGSGAKVVDGLDEDLDLQVLRALQGKTTVVPVISKADTMTSAHMAHLKQTVWDSLRQANLNPLEALGLDDNDDELRNGRIDEDDEESCDADNTGHADDLNRADAVHSQLSSTPMAPPVKRSSSGSIRQHRRQESNENKPMGTNEIPFLPLSIISPDLYEPEVIGRSFPWGFADPYNTQHCDFLRLKDAVFTDWRSELKEASRDLWYESWRTNRLKTMETKRA